MSQVQIHADDVRLESPVLVEGLPGAGLVGKIAADHLVEQFDMTYYGAVLCEGLPQVAVYRGENSEVRPPVRLFADETHDLVVLQSDVPVSPSQSPDFAVCVTEWVRSNDALPLYLSGLAEEKGDTPEVYGVATGSAESILDETGIVPPRGGGMVTGPTGALLYRAAKIGMDSVGLIVQTEGTFPDPEAARLLLEHGVEPIAGVDVDTDVLKEQAGEIAEARESLVQRLANADEDESSSAQPIRGFQ